ncbi:Ig-like domain-containing protein [Pseudovibrio ascidiaceicola]|uniref:Ig-like domain-containing protein n=1 Tax=Pseudovibrio ascidiaceicola TaxID=285279 RepID=UPI000D68662A|nr:Ig-like domain-containing protein [Pseudovibrio ascidiaceicola]
MFRIIFQDPDQGDTHTYSGNTTDMEGILTETSDGIFDYLSTGETATDTFTYTVIDNHGGNHTSTVTMTITGENDASVTSAVYVSTNESSTVLIGADFTNPDTNDTQTFTIDTTGTAGTVNINGDGTFTYDPNSQFDHLNRDEAATDTFTYTVADAAGESSTETVTVTVTINGENDVTNSPFK